MNNLFRATPPSTSNNSPHTEPPPAHVPHPKSHNKKKKLDFKTMQKNTISSLNDVEYFLKNIHQISRYMKFFKFFR